MLKNEIHTPFLFFWIKVGKRTHLKIINLLFLDAQTLYLPNFLSTKKNRPTTKIERLTKTVEMALISGETIRRSWPSI